MQAKWIIGTFIICVMVATLISKVSVEMIPVGFRKIYYINARDHGRAESSPIVVDDRYLFGNRDYSKTISGRSSYYLPHQLLFLAGGDVKIPKQESYNGVVQLEIYYDKKLLYRTISKPSEYRKLFAYDEGGRPTHVRGFILTDFPFPVEGRHEGLDFRVTVVQPDKELLKYTDHLELRIIPDLAL